MNGKCKHVSHIVRPNPTRAKTEKDSAFFHWLQNSELQKIDSMNAFIGEEKKTTKTIRVETGESNTQLVVI